jgi:hypothetical protein
MLAVAFAAALLAVAQPAVDHATRTNDAASLRASADRVADAVAALQRRSAPGETLATAPRRTLRLDLPAHAELAARGGPPRLVSRLPDGPGDRRSLPVAVESCTRGTPLDGRVTLAYVERANGPVVVALRGFISGNATTAAHACAPRTPRDDRRPRLRV